MFYVSFFLLDFLKYSLSRYLISRKNLSLQPTSPKCPPSLSLSLSRYYYYFSNSINFFISKDDVISCSSCSLKRVLDCNFSVYLLNLMSSYMEVEDMLRKKINY